MATETPWTWLAAHLRSDGDRGTPGRGRRRRWTRRPSILAVEELAYAADRRALVPVAARPTPPR